MGEQIENTGQVVILSCEKQNKKKTILEPFHNFRNSFAEQLQSHAVHSNSQDKGNL